MMRRHRVRAIKGSGVFLEQESYIMIGFATQRIINTLNGSWHASATLILLALVVAHRVEHAAQAYQVYVLHWSRPHSHGALGSLLHGLAAIEWLHYGYVGSILAGLLLVWPGFAGRARGWWTAAVSIQAWHLVEHTLLVGQVLLGQTLLGASEPTSLLQLVAPRVELHLFYNAVGFIPMAIGLFYHLFPPAGERPAVCSCPQLKVWWAPTSVRPLSQ
jgi:hypothetical protein